MSTLTNSRKVDEVYSIRDGFPDNLFITCASFEDRFLGVPERFVGRFPDEFVLFRFKHPNEKRETLIREMERIMELDRHRENYHHIYAEHGKSVDSIIELHSLLVEKELVAKDLLITVDMSTFTKDLLINLAQYLVSFLRVRSLRLLYTRPNRYASPQEGWLSYGIRRIHFPPMCWNGWSPLKDKLLIVLLGFEEMRAWSLIDRFSPDLTWLYTTSPGSRPEWDAYCREYNARLLAEIPAKGSVPALDPAAVFRILSQHITEDIAEKYNVFIAPLSTKPQLIGALAFCSTNLRIPVNMITTTVVDHNVPYYSWDVGDTYEFFYKRERNDRSEEMDL